MANWYKELKKIEGCIGIAVKGKLYKTVEEVREILDYNFDDGYGESEGTPFTLWTKDRVYFPGVYDGAEWIEDIPRNPCNENTEHILEANKMENNTFRKQTAREGYQQANGKYMGLAEEPKIGNDKDGNPYRKVKVRFLLDGKQQENKFVLWTPLSSEKSKYKSDEDLKQFQKYYLGWFEKEEKYDDKEWVSKTIQILNDESSELKQQQTIQQSAQPTATADDAFQNAMVEYLNKIRANPDEKDLRIPTRMLGACLNFAHPETFKPLLQLCEEALGNLK